MLLALLIIAGILGLLPALHRAAIALGVWLPDQGVRIFALDALLFGFLATLIWAVKGFWERLFLASALLSLLVNYGKPWRQEAILAYFAVWAFFIVWQRLSQRNCILRCHYAIKLMQGLALANMGMALYQLAFKANPFVLYVDRVKATGVFPITGFMDNANSFTAFMAVLAPSFLFLSLPWMAVLLALAFFTVLMSGSLFGIAALCAALGYYAHVALGGRSIIYGVALLVGFLLAISLALGKPSFADLSFRGKMIKRSLELSVKNPIFGHGLRYFWWDIKDKSPGLKDGPNYPEHLHNEYLEVLFEQGFLGFFALIGLIVSNLIYLLKLRTKTGVAAAGAILAIAVNSLGYYPWHVPAIAVMALLWLIAAENSLTLKEVIESG